MSTDSRGQVFSADLIFSTMVLLLVFVLVGSAWNNLQTSVAAALDAQEIQSSAAYALDFLLASRGYPEDWQSAPVFDGVSNLGLKGEQGVSLEKTIALARFARQNYSEVKRQLGLGTFDFFLSFTENVSSGRPLASGVARPPVAYFVSDSRRFYDVINASDLTWDLYFGSGTLSAPASGTSRFQYSGSKAAVLDQLLRNQSAYASVVIESPELLSSEVNASLARRFLQEGGIIIYLAGNAESEMALLFPDVSFVKKTSSVNGVVAEKNVLLPLVPLGQNVSSTGRWIVGGPSIRRLVVNVANGSEAVLAHWMEGLGHVFFVGDYDASYGGVPGRDALDVAGQSLTAGVFPSTNSSTRFVESRVFFLESIQRIPAVVTLVVWRG